jgi:hypothetical protein
VLEVVNKFSKVARYKVNIQKSVSVFVYQHWQIRKEIKETIPFAIASKRIKYLGINLTSEVKDLSTGKYKLSKEIEEDADKGKDISHSQGEDLLSLYCSF